MYLSVQYVFLHIYSYKYLLYGFMESFVTRQDADAISPACMCMCRRRYTAEPLDN